MIKGHVHLKILFSLARALADFKSPETSYALLVNKKGEREKSPAVCRQPAVDRVVKAGSKTQEHTTNKASAEFDWVCVCVSFTPAVVCEGDNMVSQLGLSSPSSDLSGTHKVFPGISRHLCNKVYVSTAELGTCNL